MVLRGSGMLCSLAVLVAFAGASVLRAQERRVSVYVSLDYEYAEEILKEFEKKTGIKVDATPDTEATKTVSLTARIIAEGKDPRADVFWNNECGQTLRLKEK